MGKSQKIKALSINTILFAISSFGTKFIIFFLVPLYTSVLSTEEYGKLDLMATTAQLLVPFLTINIQDAVLRFALEKKYNPEDVINIGMKVFCVGGGLLLLIILVIVRLPFIMVTPSYLWYLYALFVTNSLYSIFSMYLKAVNKVKLLVISGILNTLITCIMNILLLLVWKLGILGYMVAGICGLLLQIILMFMFGGIAKSIGRRSSAHLFKEMAIYSLPLVAGSVAWWINNASDRYILTFFCGAAVNGIYAVAYKIPTILSTVQSVFYNSWSISAITEFDKSDSDGFIGNVYNSFISVSFTVCSALLLANIFIAHILYAYEFFQAWQYVPFLLFGAVFNGISLFDGSLFAAAKRTKSVSATTLVGAVFNTVLNFILIPYIGALGAAIATFAGYFAVWVARTYLMKEFINIKIDWKSQISSILILLCQCIIASITDKFYIQIPLVCTIFYCQRKYMKMMLSIIGKFFDRKMKNSSAR